MRAIHVSSGAAMKMLPATWVDWWCREDIVSDRIWRNNMEVFVRATEPLLKYGPDDVVLDIGCGPGYLAGFLKDKVREIHCADVSDRYLQELDEKFGRCPHIRSYRLDPARYTDLSLLNGKRFSIIVCQSVVQYYRSIDEIEKLLVEVRGLALPGARFLISDVPVSNKVAYWSGLLNEISRKPTYAIDVLRLTARLFLSKTGAGYRSLKLLSLSEEDLARIVRKLALDAEVLAARLTSNENRLHLLIRF